MRIQTQDLVIIKAVLVGHLRMSFLFNKLPYYKKYCHLKKMPFFFDAAVFLKKNDQISIMKKY